MAPSRAMRRQLARRQFVDQMAVDAAAALSGLVDARAGQALIASEPEPPSWGCADVQRAALSHIRQCCSHAGAVKPGALSEPCRVHSLYESIEQRSRINVDIEKA